MSFKTKYITFLTSIISQFRDWGIVPHHPLFKDRAMEYSFAGKCLQDLPKGAKIMDVGFLESTLTLTLAGLGYEMHGIDIRKSPLKKFPNFTPHIEDIRKTSFEDNFFDATLALSTVEHLGLATRYGSYEDLDADKKALAEMSRVTKKNGVIVLTVPFGKATINKAQRNYDDEGIKRLIDGFKIESTEYVENFGSHWDYSTHARIQGITGYNGIILMKLINNK